MIKFRKFEIFRGRLLAGGSISWIPEVYEGRHTGYSFLCTSLSRSCITIHRVRQLPLRGPAVVTLYVWLCNPFLPSTPLSPFLATASRRCTSQFLPGFQRRARIGTKKASICVMRQIEGRGFEKKMVGEDWNTGVESRGRISCVDERTRSTDENGSDEMLRRARRIKGECMDRIDGDYPPF
jgi:hypothetical protein